MTKEEEDIIIANQNKSLDEILKAVAEVKEAVQHQIAYLKLRNKQLEEGMEYLEAENRRLENEIMQKCYPEQMEVIKGVSN